MGTTQKGLLILGTLLVLLIGGRALLTTLNPPNDKALIVEALKESIKASKEGRPGGVMDKLSSNLSYNGENESGNQGQIAKFIKESRPDVTVTQMEPVVTGDEATIHSPVDLKVEMLGFNQKRHLKDVTITFRKEEDHEWLIFPTRKWKLAEVHVPSASVADLFQPG
jgi:hypothetical protein